MEKTITPQVKEAVKDAMARLRDSIDFRNRLDAYRSVFEKTDRIITGRKVNVAIVASPDGRLEQAPGWTDGETVFLNGPLLQKDLERLQGKDISHLVLALKGVNYHELAHVLYSPRVTDDLTKKVIKKAETEGDFRWWYAFNALEDQRIETWFTATYRPAVRYFEAIALKWLVSNQQHLAEAHILIHGRKFLTPEVRYSARQAFIHRYTEDLANEFDKVIDDYLAVGLPQDTNKAYSLIKKYKELLDQAMIRQVPDLLTADNDPNTIPIRGQNRDDLIKKGRPSSADQKRAKQAVKDVVAKTKAQDKQLREKRQEKPQQPSNAQGESQGEGGETGQGQGDGEGQGEGQGQGESQGQGNSGNDQGDGPRSNVPVYDGDNNVGEGTGVGKQAGNAINETDGVQGAEAPDMKDLIDAAVDEMYEALDEALNDPELQADVQATAQAIRAAQGNANVDGKYGGFADVPVKTEARQVQRRLVHVLQRLKLDLEPTWIRRQTRGRIAIKRAMTRQPWEMDYFDQWDEGSEEEGGVEVAIIIDLSGSMGNLIGQASEALWVLKRAFDELDIRTTVLGFSDTHTILYRPADKAHRNKYRNFNVYASTIPTSALRESLQVLSSSKKPNRVLITITDGQWGGNTVEEMALVKSIKRLGTTTILLGLRGAVAQYGKHGHDLGHDMKSVKELPDIASKIVADILQRVAINA